MKNALCRQALAPSNLVISNSIYFNKVGLSLGNNHQRGMVIGDNDLFSGDKYTNIGISASNFTNTGAGQVYDIRGNKIEGRSKQAAVPSVGAGIYLTGTRDANVEDNDVNLLNYEFYGSPDYPGQYGIFVANSRFSTICTNRILGASFLDPANAAYYMANPGSRPARNGYAIYLQHSTLASVLCNTADDLKAGLLCTMDCTSDNVYDVDDNTTLPFDPPSGFQGNLFGALDYGIFCKGANTVIGRQFWAGNRWVTTGLPFLKEAKHEGTVTNVILSTFRVKSSQSPVNATTEKYWPDPMKVEAAALWFVNDGVQTNYDDCEGNPFSQTCMQNELPIRKRREAQALYRAIANGGTSLSNMPPAFQDLMKRNAYTGLKKAYEGAVMPTSYQRFIAAQSNTKIQKTEQIDELIGQIGAIDSIKSKRITWLQVKISDMVSLAPSVFASFYALSRNAQLNRLRTAYVPGTFAHFKAYKHELDSLMASVDEKKKADILSIKQLNNGFNATSTYEIDEKWLNALFLDYLGNEYAITDSIMLIVEAIADLCPEQHGMAVFKARALYVQQKNTFKPSWENCQGFIANREDNEEHQDPTDGKIRVLPNPANDVLMLVLPMQPEKSITYRIVNLYGQVVQTGNASEASTELRVEGFSSGLYLLQTTEFGTIKFMIQH